MRDDRHNGSILISVLDANYKNWPRLGSHAEVE
jgi:hypothetical protein